MPNVTLEKSKRGATVFGYAVKDPERFGVVEYKGSKVISIEEKPKNPKSNYAVVGLYFYPNDVVQKVKEIKPSKRGELEISVLNKKYLEQNRMKFQLELQLKDNLRNS